MRELAHALERALIAAAGEHIDVEHLDWSDSAARHEALDCARTDSPRADAGPFHHEDRARASAAKILLEVDDLSFASVERALIERVLAETSGNKSRAARVLGLHRATLHGKLRAHGATSSAR